MRYRGVNPKRKPTRLRPARLAVAGRAALIEATDPGGATDRRSERSVESIEQRTAGEPVMAIVTLHSQRITGYDANGWIVRAPVSSGQKGRETPAGIFAVIQKEAEHYSNLYDDAYMPYMQRITWSGIALHGGALPGYPASHGCVRMPFDFAARLFDATRPGLRVIVAPTDVASPHPGGSQRKAGPGVALVAGAEDPKEGAGAPVRAGDAAGASCREAEAGEEAGRGKEKAVARTEAQLVDVATAFALSRSA